MVSSSPRGRAGITCPSCRADVSRYDLYCGVCSQSLVDIRWRSEDHEWQQGSRRLAIKEPTNQLILEFRNEGVVPGALVFPVQSLPPWIVPATKEEILTLPPGEIRQLRISLRVAELQGYFERRNSAEKTGESGAPRIEDAKLQLSTNLTLWRRGLWTSQPFALTLVIARRPMIIPGASHYRFLPMELLRSDGSLPTHRIAIQNEAADDLVLDGWTVENDPDFDGGEDLIQVDANRLLHRPQPDEQPLEIRAGKTVPDEITLRLAEGQSLEEGPQLPGAAQLGWFAGVVTYSFRSPVETFVATTRIQGFVGAGPTLERETDSDVNVDTTNVADLGGAQERSVSLRNPGVLPVTIHRIEILTEDGREVPREREDWLRLSGLSEGHRIDPGAEAILNLGFDGSRRPLHEFLQDPCIRRVVIHHDGWNQEPVTVPIYARFGELKQYTIGIDFGTTGSVVCIIGEVGADENRVIFPLMLEQSNRREELRSVMFFEGLREDGETPLFLFGETALSAAANKPAHVVRSLKSVVSQSPDTDYCFWHESEGRTIPIRRTPQELIDEFLRELRHRAEKGVTLMGRERRKELGIDAAQAKLDNAVFSHPVEITASGRQALMTAAAAAGINLHQNDVETFFEDSCLDEATAAVLAYVDQRMAGTVAKGRALMPVERVLCFDIGGGTSDVAALEVREMDSEEIEVLVEVDLLFKAGDGSFGGDNIDRLVAGLLLDQAREQAKKSGETPQIEALRDAVESKTIGEFQSYFRTTYSQKQLGPKPPGSSKDEDSFLEDAAAVYLLGQKVLGLAERMKIQLTQLEKVDGRLAGEAGWFPGGRTKTTEPFDFELSRKDFETAVRDALEVRCELLAEAVTRTGWKWSEITTLLLTGQSQRSPVIRRIVSDYVKTRRIEEAAQGKEVKLILVDPQTEPSFDPKICVARGAALWGASLLEDPWLVVRNRILETLTFDLQRRRGRKYAAVNRLEAGSKLPAEAHVDLARAQDQLMLYRNKKPYVYFQGFERTKRVRIIVYGPQEIVLKTGKQSIRGLIQ